MSFFTLLILLSLIIVVPIFFIIKEKSKHAQLDSIQRHQEYLSAASQTASTAKIDKYSNNYSDDSNLNVIAFSSSHPFIKRLYNERVPQAFQAIMDEIGQQYENTHHSQITESQLFTLNKLIEIRIPELIDDYLSLDPNYAKTVIIDDDKSATAYRIVLEQLSSILDFTQKLNTQSQSGVVDKLLTSQRYLDEVYKDSGMTNNDLKIK